MPLSAKGGIAVINAKGKQQVVGLGEAIGDSGATLVKVLSDKVEISWGDELATLSMPNIDKTALSAIPLPAGQQLQQAAPQQQAIIQPAALQTQAQQKTIRPNNRVMLMPEQPVVRVVQLQLVVPQRVVHQNLQYLCHKGLRYRTRQLIT